MRKNALIYRQKQFLSDKEQTLFNGMSRYNVEEFFIQLYSPDYLWK